MTWNRFVTLSLAALALCSGCTKTRPKAQTKVGLEHVKSSERGLVDIVDASPPAQAAPQPLPRAGKNMMLAIGVDEYQELPRLTGAVADALAVADRMERAGYTVKRLLNRDATRFKIMIALHESLTSGAGAEARVLVYFAGHGYSDEDVTPAMGYLLPVDAAQDHVVASGISMSDVQLVLHGLPSRQVMFAADACYSGLAVNQLPFTSAGAGGRVRYSLVAGKANEQVSELDGQGVFTKYFLQGIDGSANTDGDAVVRSDELYSYVRTQVPKFVQDRFKRSQVPQFERFGEGEFVFELAPGTTGATAEACTGGRLRSPATLQNCCWYGQGWAPAPVSKCVGTPTCPSGTIPRDSDCLTAQPIALVAGESDAAHRYRVGCAGGNPRDCSDLGFLAERGAEGLTLDPALAKQLQDRACQAGSAVGCRRLAQVYLAESGTAGREQALLASQRACNANDGRGCLLLAHSLLAVADTASLANAAKALQKGCEQGASGVACEALGTMIQSGKIEPMGGQGALSFFSKACAADGQCGALAQVTPDAKLAASYTRKACSAGDAEGCARFANALAADPSVEHGTETVGALRQRACVGGVKASCIGLNPTIASPPRKPSQFRAPMGSSIPSARIDPFSTRLKLKNELIR